MLGYSVLKGFLNPFTKSIHLTPEIRELQRSIETYDMRNFPQHVVPISKHLYSGIFKDPLDTKHKIFKNRLNS